MSSPGKKHTVILLEYATYDIMLADYFTSSRELLAHIYESYCMISGEKPLYVLLKYETFILDRADESTDALIIKKFRDAYQPISVPRTHTAFVYYFDNPVFNIIDYPLETIETTIDMIPNKITQAKHEDSFIKTIKRWKLYQDSFPIKTMWF
jgi:hypothetical protein